MHAHRKLEPAFFQRTDVETIARELLGRMIISNIEGKLCGGVIVETEAYSGQNDRASHAFNGRRTKRTEVFFENGGISYVYLCYGVHHLFNVVTNRENIPDAVLIRAMEPTLGIEHMLARRGMTKLLPQLSNGPGSLAKALGISLKHNGIDLQGSEIWISAEPYLQNFEIVTSPRVGVAYAGTDALLPRRYRVMGNKWVGK